METKHNEHTFYARALRHLKFSHGRLDQLFETNPTPKLSP